MNKKGFTLVELLAVIAVLGIILLIAIPAVTTTINKSSKNIFVTSAIKIIDEAKLYIMHNNIELPVGNYYIAIPISSLNFDNKNSYDARGGVLVINNGTEIEPNYDYYIYLSNEEYLVNGSNKNDLNDYVYFKGSSAPYLVVDLPTTGSVLFNKTLGITSHVSNVTSPGYTTYTQY